MRILLDTHILIWAITTPERLEPEARAGASQMCDVWQSAVGTWRADPLDPNDRRRSDQVDAHVWDLSYLWERLFSPWMSS